MAMLAISTLPVLLGITFGYFSGERSSARLALVSVYVSGGLFLLILVSGIASMASSPASFDDHAAAVDLIAAVPGAIVLFLMLWLSGLGGAALRCRQAGRLGPPTKASGEG